MKIKQLLKKIKGIFKPPIKKYYFGKIRFGTPYFEPINFNSNIISIRKLKLYTQDEYNEYIKDKPWLEKDPDSKFSNLPMIRRSKEWIVKIFGSYYWVQIGYPIMIRWVDLGYKWKYDSIRYEWFPSFQIYFFKWQFCISWEAPDGDNDLYYEMILWYLNEENRDIKEAERTWGWIDYNTKISTWNKNYLI